MYNMSGEAVLMGLEKAIEAMKWLQDEAGPNYKRCLFVKQPDHPLMSFYGGPGEVADEFRVYIKDGHDATKVESWSVRFVGYQMGKSFKSLDDMRVWLASCVLLGQNQW
jgi:hypothetical protein